jgi:GDP-4-dehydro-6-deoxy-D-mannose reductase
VRAFVTGGSGFVGPWLVRHLEDAGDEVVVAGHDVDVTDDKAIAAAVTEAQADAIYHLAAQASVPQSWEAPAHTFEVNAIGTLNLLDAARRCRPMPRVLLVSSAEVYGMVTPDEVPIAESAPFRPVTPYAASKVAAEYLGVQAHLAHGLPVVRARPFNHVGPAQSGAFVVADLARRIVDAQRTGTTTLRVGNLSARRDFTDVRDVVRAYRLLVDKGAPGEVYNVCSGTDLAIADLAARLLAIAGVELSLEPDPDLVRPVDVPVLRGDPARIRAATGWQPEIPLDATISDVLEHWRTSNSG